MNLKLINISLLTFFILTGCGGEEKSSNQATNILSIQGEGINEVLKLDVLSSDYSLSAEGNLPVTNAFLLSERKDINKNIVGHFSFEQNSHIASVNYLGWKINGLDGNVKILNCLPLLVCTKNTTYSIADIGDQKKISINLDKAESYFMIQNENDNFIDPKKVIVSGEINFLAPKNWPIFEKNRFPFLDITGDFIVEGKTYKIIAWERKIEENTIPETKEDLFILKSDNDKIYLEFFYQGLESINPSAVYLHNKDEIYFLSKSLLNNTILENPKKIKIQIPNSIFKAKDSNEQLIVNSSLTIPKVDSNLSLNSNKIFYEMVGSQNSARVFDDKKIYSFKLKNSDDELYLEVFQEIQGHLSIKGYINNLKINCGSYDLICSGLSLDSNKKNFSFNHVQLGNYTLNGTIYFPGVFQ